MACVDVSAPVVTRPYADNDGREANLICMAHGQGGAEIGVDRCPTLTCNHEAPIATYDMRGEGFDASEDGTGRGTPMVAQSDPRRAISGLQVRRLTPMECERLQGLPDDWTNIPVRHFQRRRITKLRPEDRWEPDGSGGWRLMAADGPRYKGIGNGQTVQVMEWLARRMIANLNGF